MGTVNLVMVPLSDLTEQERKAAHLRAVRKLREYAAGRLKRSIEEIVVRDVIYGDAASSDWYDILTRTSATAGQEEWTFDSADMTAGDLSSQLDATAVVPDNKVIAFYGFCDLTPAPDVTMMRFRKGAEVKGVWEVEKCYAKEPYGGIIFDEEGDVGLVLFDPTDPMDFQINVKAAADKPIPLFALIAEAIGERVTKLATK